jgi:FkbM family methyltransferase
MMDKRLFALKDRGFQPDRILDIGCHVGDMALKFKEIWPYTEVLSVDANPYLEDELKAKKLNYKIVALSDKAGVEKNFWVSTEWVLSSGNSLYRENTPSYADGKCKTIKVVTDTLDNVFKGEKFDFIKLDTQGSELDILLSGQSVMKNAEYILMETPVREYNLGAYTIGQAFTFMSGQGFVLDDVCDLHYNDANQTKLIQVDLLFRKK